MSINNQNKPGYKHTPLGWIPEEWELKKLGEVGKVVSGLTYDPTNISSDGVLVLRSSNIKNRRLEFVDNVFVNVADGDFNPVQTGDILICVRNGSKDLIGKNAIITEEANGLAFGAFMAVFRSEWNTFLHQLFDTDMYLKEIHKNLGATINSINGSDLRLFKIPFPPKEERLKIAAILSTWDEAITKTQQLIDQLQQRNKGLMQQLLTGKKRLKGFEGEWKRLHMYDVAKEMSLKNRDDKQLTVLSCTKYDGLVPSLEYFGRRVFGSDTSTYKVVPLHHFAYATNHIEEGSIGYQSIFDEALISPMYTVFKTDGQVHDDYLFKLLKSHHYIHEYCRRMEGSIDRRGGLRWDEFSKIVIHLPELDEQIAIATLVNKAVEEVKLYQQKLAGLQQQKKGLMQKLLTGEVRVKL